MHLEDIVNSKPVVKVNDTRTRAGVGIKEEVKPVLVGINVISYIRVELNIEVDIDSIIIKFALKQDRRLKSFIRTARCMFRSSAPSKCPAAGTCRRTFLLFP